VIDKDAVVVVVNFPSLQSVVREGRVSKREGVDDAHCDVLETLATVGTAGDLSDCGQVPGALLCI
jgi:hypothetical protein